MRFTVATSAILANSLIVGKSDAKSEASSEHDLVVQAKKTEKIFVLPSGNKKQYFTSPQQQQLKPLALQASLLKNDKKNQKAKDLLTGKRIIAKECDPQVGVLACGYGQYCAESSKSALGGYCAPQSGLESTKLPGRRRQQVVGRLSIIELADLFCNRPTETGLTVDCNCTVDFASFSGEFSCYFGPDCTNINTGCGEDDTFPLCSTEQLDATLEGPTSYSYTSCYTQTLTGTSETFSYCADFSYSEDVGPACDLEVEGVACNSCSIDVGGGEQYGENCEVFDCSNTLAGYQGDRCGAFSDPVLRASVLVEYLYDNQWPCDNGCNLCGPGGRMTNGSNNFTYPSQFLDSNVTIQCYDLQYDALTGGLSQGDYCTNVPPLINEICGCAAPSTSAPTTGPVDTPNESPVSIPTDATPAPIQGAGATDFARRSFGMIVVAGFAVALSVLWGS